jgi:hypothetical protein
MPTLLLKLHGDMTFNATIFPPYLFVYNDLLIYKKRKLLSAREVTISYNQISEVSVIRGIFFSYIEIFTTGDKSLQIKFVNKKLAKQAKSIIDQKIYHSHAKHHEENISGRADTLALEKSIARLQELLARGEISDREFEKKKSQLLSKLK